VSWEDQLQQPGDPRIIGLVEIGLDHLVLDKPAGLLSVPGKDEPDCLETRVQSAYPDARTVHRLDMATSGICVMARSKVSLTYLQQQFERRETSKRYEALVWGHVGEDAGTVDAPMRCDWPNRPLQMIDHENGRSAVTHWKVLERTERTTRVELTPITGRSHQLRVHMKSLGHPIIGDRWYAEGPALAECERLALHARDLSFRSPTTTEFVAFHSPCPF